MINDEKIGVLAQSYLDVHQRIKADQEKCEALLQELWDLGVRPGSTIRMPSGRDAAVKTVFDKKGVQKMAAWRPVWVPIMTIE